MASFLIWENFYFLENKLKLTIELVPSTSWYTNVRSHVSAKQWTELKKITSVKANYKCEICSGVGARWPVECHEIWEYDDINHIQLLKGLIALCPKCHQVKHIGLSQVQGYFRSALAHLQKVNNITEVEAKEYIAECFSKWESRSKFEWTIDYSYLDRFGFPK